MTRHMTKTVDYTVDVTEEVPQWGSINSGNSPLGIACRIRLFIPCGPNRSPSGTAPDLLPALPILILCWTIRGKGRLPSGWLESYVGLLHVGIASLPRPVTLIERITGGNGSAGGMNETVRRVFFETSRGSTIATFQAVHRHEVEQAIGERLNDGKETTGVEEAEEREHRQTDYEDMFPVHRKRGPCCSGGVFSQSHINSLGEAIHEAAVSQGKEKGHRPILDERVEYLGYHGCRSVCRMRVFNPRDGNGWPDKRPLAVIFTELPDNPGTSVTNRIEHLATLAWHRLGMPEPVPLFIEHYPNRGVYNRTKNQWQIPESFSFVGMSQNADGIFCNPDWQHTTRMTVEIILGQRFDGL